MKGYIEFVLIRIVCECDTSVYDDLIRISLASHSKETLREMVEKSKDVIGQCN